MDKFPPWFLELLDAAGISNVEIAQSVFDVYTRWHTCSSCKNGQLRPVKLCPYCFGTGHQFPHLVYLPRPVNQKYVDRLRALEEPPHH